VAKSGQICAQILHIRQSSLHVVPPVTQNVIGNNVGTETFSPVRPGGVVVRVTTEDQHHTRRHNGRVQIPAGC